ncbi:MAG: helicase-related protein, partial [bacterium]|nr:helicase-related protein [bacterium]
MAVQHVDGKTPAIVRAAQLDRLRADPEPGRCQVISNARVLTEGVDVPALDAVVFLQPRKSKIDIVQAVGRVMRTYPGKQTGYIVIPVVVPESKGVTDTEVLDGSDFATVWDVVRALRSHDERMDMWVNHIDAARNSDRITLIDRKTDQPLGDDEGVEQLRFLLDERIASKMVERCGDRKMWPSWGAKAAGVCQEVRKKVDAQLAVPDTAEAFHSFVMAMRTVVGDRLTDEQAAEMVAQHIVTIPIFDCLFADSHFGRFNPVSVAMNTLLQSFTPASNDPAAESLPPVAMFEDKLRPLTRAYRAMQSVFDGALTPAAKVDVLREVYDGFFKSAMEEAVKRLGIVYTPVELVDFIIRSADAVCRKQFGVGITSENINILDPFAGTGTFLYRLLTATDSDDHPIIRDEDLHRKYYSELFANEMVLLAYYIAAIKIEAGMAERGGFAASKFNPFPGITFSDTFLEMAPNGSQLPGMADNIARQSRQGGVPITVIVMNPPWSAGQKSTGEDNPKIDYPHIEERVRGTYGKRHRQVADLGAGKSAGNLYVQAIRWASDRLGQPDTIGGRGVVAMVHPNSLATGTTLAGMRATLRDEFTDIYVINLRGDAMKSGEEFDIEGAKIFGQGSRNGVQITVLARNPAADRPDGGIVHYAAVPEYSTLDQKLQWLAQLGDATSDQLEEVPANNAHHWVNLTDGSYETLMRVCATSREPQDELLSHASAGGVMTACDPYVYAFDYDELVNKVTMFIDTYDSTLARVQPARSQVERAESRSERIKAKRQLDAEIAAATTNSPQSLRVVKWTGKLKQALRRGDVIEFDASRIRQVQYRPFTKVWMYEDSRILDKVEAVSSLFAERGGGGGGGGGRGGGGGGG